MEKRDKEKSLCMKVHRIFLTSRCAKPNLTWFMEPITGRLIEKTVSGVEKCSLVSILFTLEFLQCIYSHRKVKWYGKFIFQVCHEILHNKEWWIFDYRCEGKWSRYCSEVVGALWWKWVNQMSLRWGGGHLVDGAINGDHYFQCEDDWSVCCK